MERSGDEKMKITLECGSDKSRDWMCEGNVAQHLHRIDGTFSDRNAEVYQAIRLISARYNFFRQNFVFNGDAVLWSPQICYYCDVFIWAVPYYVLVT